MTYQGIIGADEDAKAAADDRYQQRLENRALKPFMDHWQAPQADNDDQGYMAERQ